MNAIETNYKYSPTWMQDGGTANVPGAVQANNGQTSVFEGEQQPAAVATTGSSWSDGCDDGSNEGKITFGSGVCAFLKGIGKSAVNTVVGILTDPKKLLLTAATAAVCIAFPPAGVALGVVGMVGGACQMAKGAYTAYNVYKNGGTDAQTKAAIQDAGAGFFQFGMSALAVKGGMKAMKATEGSAMNALAKSGKSAGLKGMGETVRAFAKDTVTGGRGAGGEGYLATRAVVNVKNNIKNEGSVTKGLAKSTTDAWKAHKDAKVQRAGQKQSNKYDKMDDAAKQEFDASQKKALADAEKQLADAKKAQADLKADVPEAEVNAAKAKVTAAENNLKSVEARQAAFKDAQAKTATLKENYNDALKSAEQKLNQYNEANKAYNEALKGGDKAAIEAAKARVNATGDEMISANNALQAVKGDLRLASSNTFAYNGQRFANAARNAGYSSSFGALTAPITGQNMVVNANSNYNQTLTREYNERMSNYGSQLTYNTGFGSATGSTYVAGTYAFDPINYDDVYAQSNQIIASVL